MNNQSYYNFWQRIHKSADNKRFPLRVMFELTYECNFKCKHCYVPRKHKEKKGELTTGEVFNILDQLKDAGCFYLGFTGGEPFTRKDIIPIFQYAKKCGFEIIIYTNGSLIDEKIASQLQRLQPNKVDITIPGMSPKACDSISGMPGSRDKIFKAINLLYKKGVNLGFKTCVLKKNELEISKIEDFAASLGALHRLDTILLPRLDGSQEPYEYRGKLEDMSHTKKRIAAGCDSERINGETVRPKGKPKSLFKCGVGRSQAAITPFGELKMCLMIDYPKYRILDRGQGAGEELKGAWQKLIALVGNIKADENYRCNKCELEPYCRWCPGKAWLSTGTFTGCDLQSKHRAERLYCKDRIKK